MPNAEIITIGTEILLGEIVDTNAAYIARALRRAGVDLFRKTSVGDNPQRIAQAIRQAMEGSEIVITTGGLGPTIDDPTRDAVALALDMKTEYRPELWEQIQARFKRYERAPTENNKKQAYIPEKARILENPVGTAPCFLVEVGKSTIISLPGVPSEMEYMMEHDVIPYINGRFPDHSVLEIKIIHSSGAGESQIDELIGDLEEMTNPTVGLAAHSGQIDIRIVAKASSKPEAEAMIEPVRQDIYAKLKHWIYGEDEDTLENVALQKISAHGWNLAVLEFGLAGALLTRLARAETVKPPSTQPVFYGGEMQSFAIDADDLKQRVGDYRKAKNISVVLGVTLIPRGEKQEVHMVFISPDEEREFSRPYGGPPKNATTWAVNQSINVIRQVNHVQEVTIKI